MATVAKGRSSVMAALRELEREQSKAASKSQVKRVTAQVERPPAKKAAAKKKKRK